MRDAAAAGGSSSSDARARCRFNCCELADAGFAAHALRQARLHVVAFSCLLFCLGFHAVEFTPLNLHSLLLQAGFSCIDMKRSGCSARAMKEAGCSAGELREAGVAGGKREQGCQHVGHQAVCAPPYSLLGRPGEFMAAASPQSVPRAGSGKCRWH